MTFLLAFETGRHAASNQKLIASANITAKAATIILFICSIHTNSSIMVLKVCAQQNFIEAYKDAATCSKLWALLMWDITGTTVCLILVQKMEATVHVCCWAQSSRIPELSLAVRWQEKNCAYQCYYNVQLLNQAAVVNNLAWEVHKSLYSQVLVSLKKTVCFTK